MDRAEGRGDIVGDFAILQLCSMKSPRRLRSNQRAMFFIVKSIHNQPMLAQLAAWQVEATVRKLFVRSEGNTEEKI